MTDVSTPTNKDTKIKEKRLPHNVVPMYNLSIIEFTLSRCRCIYTIICIYVYIYIYTSCRPTSVPDDLDTPCRSVDFGALSTEHDLLLIS